MNRNQSFLVVLIGGLLILTFFVIRPFAQYVIGAAILTYVLYPLHLRLTGKVGAVPSAFVLISAALIVVVLPLAYIMIVFLRNLRAIARGESGLDVETIERRYTELTGEEVDLATGLAALGQEVVQVLFGGTSEIVAGTVKVGLGLAMVLFLVYYLLLEGPAFVGWLRDLLPLSERVTDELFTKIDATTWGVVIAEIFVAIVQAVLGGIALWLVGIPNPAFWTFVMAIFALLPLIGAFLVWGPASVYLLFTDQVTAGILLGIWGLTVVSLFDNYARPIVIDQRAHINPGVILVGVLGGVYAIGFTGLFVGPILIGILASTLEIFRTEFEAV